MITFSDDEFYLELKGIAEAIDLPYHQVLALNYMYELDAWCSSIIARLSNGTLILGRNFDFYNPNETSKTMFIGRFYQGTTFLFEAQMLASLTLVVTGYRPGAYALTVNERGNHEVTSKFYDNLGMIFSGVQ